jgi:hypothetical protein
LDPFPVFRRHHRSKRSERPLRWRPARRELEVGTSSGGKRSRGSTDPLPSIAKPSTAVLEHVGFRSWALLSNSCLSTVPWMDAAKAKGKLAQEFFQPAGAFFP